MREREREQSNSPGNAGTEVQGQLASDEDWKCKYDYRPGRKL